MHATFLIRLIRVHIRDYTPWPKAERDAGDRQQRGGKVREEEPWVHEAPDAAPCVHSALPLRRHNSKMSLSQIKKTELETPSVELLNGKTGAASWLAG